MAATRCQRLIALAIIGACEADLGRTLEHGERVDVLCDNLNWDYLLIREIVNDITGTMGE